MRDRMNTHGLQSDLWILKKNAILKAHLDDCLRVLCRQKASIVDGVSSKFRGRLLINTSLTKIRIGKDIKLLVIILIPFIMIIQKY